MSVFKCLRGYRVENQIFFYASQGGILEGVGNDKDFGSTIKQEY